MPVEMPLNIETVALAVIAMLSPLLLSYLTTRNARIDREHAWAREDRVAELAAQTSRKMLEKQDTNIAVLEQTAKVAAAGQQQLDGQLKGLHTLVNSNLTIALQAELGSTERELEALREVRELKRGDGEKISAEAGAVIKTAEERVLELRRILADRRKTDALATAQAAGGDARALAMEAAAEAAPAAAAKAARDHVPPVVVEVVPPVVKTVVKEALKEHDKKE